jgi:CheY-like chemotaxis protein
MAKIIVADDDENIRSLLGSILEGKGLEVILCSHGKELMEKVKETNGNVSLVLTDNDMPYMNGVEAARIMRRELGYMFPIWLMSGRTVRDQYGRIFPEEELKLKGDKAGITGYLPKPFGLNDLSDIMKTLQPAHEDSKTDSEQQYSGD